MGAAFPAHCSMITILRYTLEEGMVDAVVVVGEGPPPRDRVPPFRDFEVRVFSGCNGSIDFRIVVLQLPFQSGKRSDRDCAKPGIAVCCKIWALFSCHKVQVLRFLFKASESQGVTAIPGPSPRRILCFPGGASTLVLPPSNANLPWCMVVDRRLVPWYPGKVSNASLKLP